MAFFVFTFNNTASEEHSVEQLSQLFIHQHPPNTNSPPKPYPRTQ
ncbi:hypothetical protein RRSWK_07180 [Rhodopirellula sp. SWK7]|nr:hypothetical protein RRSWK_07180 [Rhodopirellula sp. SWK7]